MENDIIIIYSQKIFYDTQYEDTCNNGHTPLEYEQVCLKSDKLFYSLQDAIITGGNWVKYLKNL